MRPGLRCSAVVACGLLAAALDAPAVELAPGDILAVDGRVDDSPIYSPRLLRIDPVTGAREVIARVPNGLAVALDSEGRPLMTQYGGVVRVDPATGASSVVSQGGFLRDGFAIAIEADGRILVPSGTLEGSIVRIDPETGEQTLLSEGGDLQCPSALSLLADGDNCLGRWNPTQSDADRDGFGNLCDGDFDGDGRVGARDLATLGRAFGARTGNADYDPAVDLNDDGAIGGADFLVWVRGFADPPGPSGLACAGSQPCP